MAERIDNTVAPELKLAAQLLLDTEKKLEMLQAQIDQLQKPEGPAPALKPGGFVPANQIAMHRQQLLGQQNQLKATTLSIVEDLQKTAQGKTQMDIDQLKSEWLIDIQPGKEGEDQKLRKSMRDMGRMRSEKWKAADMPVNSQTKMEENKMDIDGRQASLMDKARGLQQQYSYLDPKEPEKDMTEKNDPGKDDGPDIEPEID